jgi:hypothetical protein
VVLDNGGDYTATNGTSVVLTSGAAAGDLLQVIAFKSFTVADMVPASTGGTFAGNVTVDGNLTATTLSGDGSSLTGVGKVLQVVQAFTSTGTTTTSTGYVLTSLSASITPSSASNKVLAFAAGRINNQASGGADLTFFRGGVNIAPTGSRLVNNYFDRNGDNNNQAAFMFLDAPSTTSATTYTVALKSGTGTVSFDQTQLIILMEIAG